VQASAANLSVLNTAGAGTNARKRLIYLLAMKFILSLPAWLRALLLNFALWAVLCMVAGMTTYGDAVRAGDTRGFFRITLGWWCGYFVMMMQSYLLYMLYRSRANWLATPRRIAAGYAVYIALCWPLAMLGLAYRRCFKFDIAPTLWNAWRYWASMDKFEWFVVFTLLTMAWGVVVAGLLWRQRQQQASALAQALLALERQRLAALRGQLEPHFIFNTLSAIGAMVRTDDKALALDGLARLGDLIAYALASSESNWVSMERELQFVQDYLDLQRLRFGQRLRVRVEGAGLLDDGVECPPMLLQPLVENALRHDLECQAGDSDITVRFMREGCRLVVQVSNPVHQHAAPAAGLGIGLRGIRARLQLAYGSAASIEAANVAGRFTAVLALPLALAE
jgi:hypothetical protein